MIVSLPPATSTHFAFDDLMGAEHYTERKPAHDLDAYTRPSSPGHVRRKNYLTQEQTKVAALLQKDNLRKPAKNRNNSLRNVKNSNELLRQRSTHARAAHGGSDGTSAMKEGGRHFTVSNVGVGGMIYLRPSANQPPQLQPVPPFVFPPPTPPKSVPLESNGLEPAAGDLRLSNWSTSQMPASPPRHVLRRFATDSSRDSTPFMPYARPSHIRSYSSSTLDEDDSADEVNDGALRIVINRSPTKELIPTEILLPTLQVPIPHYRLGTPRFSTYGTPILRSSAYTRTSTTPSEDLDTPDLARTDLLFPVPPGSDAKGMLIRQGTGVSLDHDHFGSDVTHTLTRSSVALPSPTIAATGNPVEPTIFDIMVDNKDDPSVVRYSPKNGQITAATPARIIAQISSEEFMDYELVSDFFLTFRLYLSTEKLLGLLLARLRWAINRLEDDGRVIRIRTFAALRHWILNYFMDDFVVNRDLRVQFCDQINEMYREVSTRTTGGVSDLKILQDLKRCWNGRCLLYWESAEFLIDAHQRADIVPGGVAEDSVLSRPHFIPMQRPLTAQPAPRDRKDVAHSWFGEPPTSHRGQSRNREVSTATQDVPQSPVSVQSLQPGSCSIPAKMLKRSALGPDHAKAPHPVPVQQKSRTSNSHNPGTKLGSHHNRGHVHKRSGSFSDSIRDRGSTTTKAHQVVLMLPQSGSLIRGNVYLPIDPHVEVVAPASPPTNHSKNNSYSSDSASPTDEASRSNSQSGPAVRTIIGSIRRALSGKQGLNYAPPRTAGSQKSDRSLQGKTSALPLNISRPNDASGGKPLPSAPRANPRIDLLCAATSQRYKIAQAEASDHEPSVNPGIGIALGDIPTQSLLSPEWGQQRPNEADGPRRLASQITARSGSIVIMDDTGVDLSTLSGGLAVPFAYPNDDNGTIEGAAAPATVAPVFHSAMVEKPATYNESQRSSGVLGRRSSSVGAAARNIWRGGDQPGVLNSVHLSRDGKQNPQVRSISLDRSPALRSSNMTSTTLRRPGSHQKSVARPPLDQGLVETTTDGPVERYADENGPAIPQPVLRRRPGGDLRKIQNVHDLEPALRHQSSGSVTTGTDSLVGSMLLMGNVRTIGPVNEKVAKVVTHPVSMIRTHSSQNLRPSFEAALAGFSSIPDDIDGGLEATLLKLEGKYEKSPDLAQQTVTSENRRSSVSTNILDLTPQVNKGGEETHSHGPQNVPGDTNSAGPVTSFVAGAPNPRQPSAMNPPASFNDVRSATTSAYSNPITQESGHGALSDHSLSDDQMHGQNMIPHNQRLSGLPGSFFSRNYANIEEPPSELPKASVEGRRESASPEDKSKRLTWLKRESPTAESFLLDEDEDLSDLSSELSVDVIEHFEVRNHTMSPMIAAPGTAISGLEIPTHPLAHPPSPSFTLEDLSASAPVHPITYGQMPPTPEYSPTPAAQKDDGKDSFTELMHLGGSGAANSPELAAANSGHIPFVLAYDSEILAQQFTLVEKAALSEVDWNDLVEMRWDNKSTNHLNWVEYLATKDDKGIDVVITRFNLMVKWVLSEIVLTQDIQERAWAITKYIHVAAHSRRLHNYATMLQITIALTSIDCTRLKKTWELVQSPERSLLKNMETLIQPIKNFHDLRVEMETANLLDGCIPFVGLYIHDLTYNAQKPAQIASTRDNEPLVNFERYRTAATVVKGLLRLIDASSQYNFPPVEGIIERCLWVAALSDDRIQALSKAIE